MWLLSSLMILATKWTPPITGYGAKMCVFQNFLIFPHFLFQNKPRSWIFMVVFIGLIYPPLSSTTLSYTQLLKWGHSNILVCKCILEMNKKNIIKTSHSSKYLGRPLGQNLVQFDAKVKVCLRHCKIRLSS